MYRRAAARAAAAATRARTDRHQDLRASCLGGKSLLSETPQRLADVVVVVLFEAVAADERGDVLDDCGPISRQNAVRTTVALDGAAAPRTGRRRLLLC